MVSMGKKILDYYGSTTVQKDVCAIIVVSLFKSWIVDLQMYNTA